MLICGLAWLGACSDSERSQDASAPETKAAPAQVLDLQGKSVTPLPADAPATVLLFVSTHCPISNRYAPTMSQLAELWARQGVRTWLVYPDPDDTPEAIAKHQAEFSLTIPTLRDPEHALVTMVGAKVTPEAAVFAPGKTAPTYHGRIDDRVVEFGKMREEATKWPLIDAVQAVAAGVTPKVTEDPGIGCYISDLR